MTGCKKRTFFTRKLAKQALKGCRRTSTPEKKRLETQIYTCPHCGFYHLTSQTPDWKKK